MPIYSNDISNIENMFADLPEANPGDQEGIIVPKDLYLSYLEDEMVFPSIGFSFDGVYNYYNKVITNFAGFLS